MKVCTNAYTVAKKDNYFSVMTNSVEIRILFLTDSILRIRAAPERTRKAICCSLLSW